MAFENNEEFTNAKKESLPIEDILNGTFTDEEGEDTEEYVEAEVDETPAVEESGIAKMDSSVLDNNMQSNPKDVEKPASIVSKDPFEGLSPLEKLRMQRDQAQQGLVVEKSTKEVLDDSKELKNFAENDVRMEAMDARVEEADETLEKRNRLVLIKPLKNQMDHMNSVAEIKNTIINADGSVTLPEGAQFFRERDMEHEDIMGKPLNPDGTVDENAKAAADPSNNELSEAERELAEYDETIPEENRKIAKVLIDKTGLGGDWQFTPEEREKLNEADEIQVRHVKVLDIAAIKAKSSSRSFQDVINDMDTSGTRTKMAFPASGYTAQLKGMSFGEYSDVALDIDVEAGKFGDFDQNYKRLSILYNKITNVSCSPFESFEDFLRRTAWSDIDLGLFGLLISTEPEKSNITLRCGGCGNNFDVTYNPRSLIQFKYSGLRFMEKWKEILAAPPSEYQKIHDNSLVNNSVFIELPESKAVAEVGVVSCYEYLYNFIPISEPTRFAETFSSDDNDVHKRIINYLLSVKTMRIPDGDEYVVSDSYKDIIDAIYSLPVNDLRLLTSYTNKFLDDTTTMFAFTGNTCPHCGNKMPIIPIEMSELVFQAYLQSMNTSIDPDSIVEI